MPGWVLSFVRLEPQWGRPLQPLLQRRFKRFRSAQGEVTLLLARSDAQQLRADARSLEDRKALLQSAAPGGSAAAGQRAAARRRRTWSPSRVMGQQGPLSGDFSRKAAVERQPSGSQQFLLMFFF